MSSIRSKRVAAALAATLALGGLTACQPNPRSAMVIGMAPDGVTPHGLVAAPQQALPRQGMVALPAVAATSDPLAVAAGMALWALWFDDATYDDKLEVVIQDTAFRAGVSAHWMGTIWRRTSRDRMIVLLSALTQIGVPYRRYESKVGSGFDCSGLTGWAWSQIGVSLPRVSARQIRQAAPVRTGWEQPGDLLYYPGHIMMALGIGTAIIHAPYTGGVVEVRPMIAGKSARLKAGSPI